MPHKAVRNRNAHCGRHMNSYMVALQAPLHARCATPGATAQRGSGTRARRRTSAERTGKGIVRHGR